jgi:hypothetical protein
VLDAPPHVLGARNFDLVEIGDAPLGGIQVAVGCLEEPGPATVLTDVLRRVALRWLTELGVRHEEAESLISSEAKLGDRWLAYLAHSPVSVIDDLLDH